MKKFYSHFVLLFILFLSLFFRTYQIVERFQFAHDADLYSWIVRDIVINHHPRLIGQLTSAPGIYIGPLFYYSLVPFFLLTQMDPIGALIPITILGLATTLAYYWVFKKLFNPAVGLMAAFLQSVLIDSVNFDRWVVPSTPTNLWSILYFYCLISLCRNNFKVLPLLGVLIGLIWEIHIALAPALLGAVLVILINKRPPSLKLVSLFLVTLIITSLPLIIFETKHDFTQTKSLWGNFTASFAGPEAISENRQVMIGPDKSISIERTSGQLFSLSNTESTLNIATANPKYTTLSLDLSCGKPTHYEIGTSLTSLNWDISSCSIGKQTLRLSARTTKSPVNQKYWSKLVNLNSKEFTNINNLLITPLNLPIILTILLEIILVALPFWLFKPIEKFGIYGWIIGVVIFFVGSSIPISEYYLANFNPILIGSLSLGLIWLFKKGQLFKIGVLVLLGFLVLKSLIYFLNPNFYVIGYLDRKMALNYIQKDSQQKGWPCLALSYSANLGDQVGFRYFSWLYGLHLISPQAGGPSYTVVIPSDFSPADNQHKFGHIGIIPPTQTFSQAQINQLCSEPDYNLVQPVLGFTN